MYRILLDGFYFGDSFKTEAEALKYREENAHSLYFIAQYAVDVVYHDERKSD